MEQFVLQQLVELIYDCKFHHSHGTRLEERANWGALS